MIIVMSNKLPSLFCLLYNRHLFVCTVLFYIKSHFVIVLEFNSFSSRQNYFSFVMILFD